MKYLGLDPPMDESKRTEVEAGELCRGVKAWEQDPYGVGQVLIEKRRARGWATEREQMCLTEAMHGAEESRNKDLMAFMKWWHTSTDNGRHYPGILPWS
jgi:hypothetical protein